MQSSISKGTPLFVHFRLIAKVKLDTHAGKENRFKVGSMRFRRERDMVAEAIRDIDKDLDFNPLQCAEYSKDIFDHLKILEASDA